VAADAFPLACLIVPPINNAVSIVARPALAAQSTRACFAGDVLPTFLVSPSIPVRDSIGAFLYVERNMRQLTIAGSLAWEAGPDRAQPTPLQSIRESDFRTGTGSLLAIPVIPETRYALRVYALPETLTAESLVVRIFEMQPQLELDSRERLVAEFQGKLEPQNGVIALCAGECDVPDVPLAPAVYQLFDLPLPQPGFFFQSPIRIEISPGSPDIRWWALVSATDNRSQEVRLFQPSF
jgi:hypothetical protein